MILRVVAIALLTASLANSGVSAQERPGAQPPDSMATLDFQQVELRLVLAALAEMAGLNVTYGLLPDLRVTLRTSQRVSPTEVRSMLESVARANGVVLIEDGGLIRLEAAEPVEVEEIPDAAPAVAIEPQASRERQLFVHALRHATAENMVRTVGSLFGVDRGGTADLRGRGTALSEVLQEQRDAPFRFDEPEPATGVGDAGGSGIGMGLTDPVDMVPDLLTNSVLILATAADYAVLQAAIQQLDVRPLQVLIEVVIAEVRHNQVSDLGIDVSIPAGVGDDPEVSFQLTGASAGDVAMQILGIGGRNADVVIRALATRADVRVMSRPLILAQNNREARIMVGDQRPFIQMIRAFPTEVAVRDQVVQYRDVGTQLSIRPTINADGYVHLSIVQEVSNATSESQFGAPVINTREIESELLIKDGQTAVLGGLVDHVEQVSHSGIPLLKDIPLLGAIFRSTSRSEFANELLVMVTPYVIRTDADLRELSRGLRTGMPEIDEEIRRGASGLDTLLVRPDTVPGVPDSLSTRGPGVGGGA